MLLFSLTIHADRVPPTPQRRCSTLQVSADPVCLTHHCYFRYAAAASAAEAASAAAAAPVGMQFVATLAYI